MFKLNAYKIFQSNEDKEVMVMIAW